MVLDRTSWMWRVGAIGLAALLSASILGSPLAEWMAAPISASSVPGNDDDDTSPELKHARQFEAAGQRPAKRAGKPTPPSHITRSQSVDGTSTRRAPAPFHATFNRPLHC